MKQQALFHTQVIQPWGIKWHQNFIRTKKFQKGHWELLYDFRFKYFKGEFRTIWVGHYEIKLYFRIGSLKIKTIHEDKSPFMVNE